MGARKLPASEQPYPNYLFSFIFQSTNLCGENFYQCTKGLNSFFLIGLLVVFYCISRRLFPFTKSIYLSAVVALSPMTVFASFFMPEVLFYFLNTLAILLVLRAVERPGLFRFLLLSLVLALALLTKRHELFLLPGFAIALFLLVNPAGRSVPTRLVQALTIALMAPVALRQGFVFAATGDFFAPILGSTYGQSFRETTSSGSGSGSAVGIFELMSQGFWHLLMHVAVIAISGLGIARLQAFREMNQKDRSAYSIILVLTVTITVSIVPVVVFFESYLTLVGDDHSLRLLMRYYEFLLLPILLLASSKISMQELVDSRKRWLLFLVPSYLVFVLVIGPFIETGPSDSPFIHGLKLLGPAILVFLLALVLPLSSSKTKSRSLKQWVVVLTIPALLLSSGIAVRIDVADSIGSQPTFYDFAGIVHKDLFPKVAGKRVLILGATRTEVTATKFWIDKPGIRHVLEKDLPRPISQKRLEGIRYVIALYPTRFLTNQSSELVFAGRGFSIYEIKKQ